MTNFTMTKLIVILLVGLLALSNTVSVQAKGNLVRGAHSSKTLKHHSMAARRLMKDEDNKDKEEVDEDEIPQEAEENDDKEDDDKEDDDKNNDDEEAQAEEEVTDAPDAQEGQEGTQDPDDTTVESEIGVPDTEDPADTTPEEPVVEDPLPEVLPEEVTPDASTPSTPNATTDGVVMPGQEFSVVLNPFSLTVDGAITEDDLELEDYLFNYMKTFMPNLVSIDLDSETVVDGQIVSDADTAPSTDAAGDEGNSTRMLRTTRGLTVQTFYFDGNASFVGPPMRPAEEVDAALTYALEDTAALQTHLEATFPSANVAITANADDPKPTTDGVSAEEEDETKEDGLSTTGLSIVIVAACVGGISLLIILMVGLSGPSGDTSGIKGGLPEQPLQ